MYIIMILRNKLYNICNQLKEKNFMFFPKLKTLISTHNDLDAVGSMIVTRYYAYLLNNPDIWSNGYEDIDYAYEDLKKYELIIYPDFSPDEKARKIIQENNIVCYIFDHHEVVYNDIIEWKKEYKNVHYVYTTEFSGAKIFYNFIKENYSIEINPVLEQFIEYVSIYDTWEKNNPSWIIAQNLNRLLYKSINYKIKNIHKYDLFIDMMNSKFNNDTSFSFNRLEEIKINQDIKKEKELFQSIISKPNVLIKSRKDSKGNYFAIIKCNSKISAICNMILEKYKKLDYIIAINYFDENNPKVSLRSKEHFNLLELQNVKGHENSAGYENPTIEFCSKLWDNTLYEIPYKN